MELVIAVLFALFVLWLGTRILDKAGFEKTWVLCLLIPIVNIIMIWVFAFSRWPNLKAGVKQDL
ncbi:MAG: hypothetical protein ACU84J_03090 [Gammaproteobacteria bacterium]